VALFFYTQDIEVLMQQCQQKNAKNLLLRREAISDGFSFVAVRLFLSQPHSRYGVRFADKTIASNIYP